MSAVCEASPIKGAMVTKAAMEDRYNALLSICSMMQPMTGNLRQVHINWLLKSGVSPEAMIHPTLIEVARGKRASDGIFEPSEDGPEWLAFTEAHDLVFWRPATGELATDRGIAFALGADAIGNPGVTALGGWLHLHATPLEWLQSGRQGIVVIHWRWAFDQLRDFERIAVAEELLDTYRKHMKPRLPELGVIQRQTPEVAA
jgi:hypothetical protein